MITLSSSNKLFRELWGIFKSLRHMVDIFLFLFFVIFLFALMGKWFWIRVWLICATESQLNCRILCICWSRSICKPLSKIRILHWPLQLHVCSITIHSEEVLSVCSYCSLQQSEFINNNTNHLTESLIACSNPDVTLKPYFEYPASPMFFFVYFMIAFYFMNNMVSIKLPTQLILFFNGPLKR